MKGGRVGLQSSLIYSKQLEITMNNFMLLNSSANI